MQTQVAQLQARDIKQRLDHLLEPARLRNNNPKCPLIALLQDALARGAPLDQLDIAKQ